MRRLRVNIVSESDLSVQAHGVHTAYVEMARALEARDDVEVIRGAFGKAVDCDVVHLHTVGPRVWKKLWQKGPKKVISAHVVPDSFVGSLILATYWKPLAAMYLRWFYNHADLVLAVSQETERDLLAMGVTAPIGVLTNFINTENYKNPSVPRDDIRRKLGIPEHAFVVIGAGQVQPRKRIDSFITTAKKLPDMYFVWIGGVIFGRVAADNAAMHTLMKSAPENVLFPGVVPLDDMPSYYHAADAFFLPSVQETFGLVVVEAAAAGLPIVLRDIPDYDATFGDDAIRCSEEEFSEELQKLQRDDAYYREAAIKADKLARRYDSRTAAARLVALYQGLHK